MTNFNSFCFFIAIPIFLILSSMTLLYGQTSDYDSVICDIQCISEFSIPDFEKPFVIIQFNKESYTWASQVRVIISAPSWNTDKDKIDIIGEDEEHPIRISTRGHSITPYSLIELSPNSGKFFGKFKLTGFLHDADGDGSSDLNPTTGGSGPYGGKLEADREDAVTISFEAVDGVVLVKSAPIKWNIGEVKFGQTSYVDVTHAKVIVNDNDMNLIHNQLETVKIEVYSDLDGTGGIDMLTIASQATATPGSRGSRKKGCNANAAGSRRMVHYISTQQGSDK